MTRVAFAPLFLLIILGAIVGLVLRKRPGVLVIVGGLIAAVVAFFILASHTETFRHETPARQWIPSDDQYANASVYPSAESAARIVGANLAKDIAQRTGSMRPSGMDVVGPAPQAIRATIASKIADTCPYLRLAKSVPSVESAQTTRPTDHLIVTVDDIEDRSGRGERILQATAEIPHMGDSLRRTGASAYYVNKPWAENPPGFHQPYPNKQFLVAWSDSASVNMEEAILKARHNAAAQMMPRVWQRLKVERPGQEFDSQHIHDQIEMMIANGRVPQDRFAQEMGRSYGRIWRAAVMVDSSDSTAHFLAGNIASQMNADQRLFGSRVLSIGALLVLIVIVYVLLNAITKGYFSKTLQAGAVVALLIGLLALMLMA